jgi:hypothetical protein
MARRTKYTKELVAELLQILTEGNTIETACGCVGIGQETFFGWQRNKTEFAEAVQKAQKAAIRRNVGIVQVAAKKSWQAAAWWLERRHPQDYALRRPVEDTEAISKTAKDILEQIDNDSHTQTSVNLAGDQD